MMPPQPPVPAPPSAPGTTAPAAMPPKNAGMEGQARVIGSMVAKALNQMLSMLDPMGEDARDVRKMLDICTKRFGPAAPGVTSAQVKTFASQVPAAQPGPQAHAQQKLGAMGLPQPAQPA